MKRILLISVLFLAVMTIKSQYNYFNKRYNQDYGSCGWSILEAENNYVICGVGAEVSQDYVFMRILMVGLDYNGEILWWKTYGEDFHNYYSGITRGGIRTSDGGYAVSGSVEDSERNVGMLMKFNSDGDSLWTRIYGDTITPGYTGTNFYACKQLPDKGYLLSGSEYISGDDADILLIRTDSLGNKIWENIYGALHIVETGYSIAQLPGGEFLIGIQRQNLNLNYSADPGLLKVDSLGNQIWIKYYGSSMEDWGCAVDLSNDGNYLVGSAYCTAEPLPGYPLLQPWIFKTDTSGNILWETKIEGPRFIGDARTIDELDDGSIITSGVGGFDESMNYQGYILKVDQDGDSIWMRRYDYYKINNGYLNYLHDLCLTSDNGIIFTGQVLGEPEWEQSLWVQKLDSIGCDSTGCDTTVGIREPHMGMDAWGQERVKLWPNPAKDWINILFYENPFDRFSTKTLEIYNMLGEKVIETELHSLTGAYAFNVSGFPNGVYLIIIRDRQNVLGSCKFLISR